MDSPLAPHSSTPSELQERRDAERAGVPFLVWRDAGATQRIAPLHGARAAVGRGPENDVSLPHDDRVSRLHAMLEQVGGEWTLVDDGLSRNGTFLGPDRLSGRRRLSDGDVFRCGTTLIGFCDPISGGTAATADGEGIAAAARVSDAQRRVLVALCRPYREGADYAVPATNQEICDELFLSLDAVKSHLRALFEKFGLSDLPQNAKRAALVERAMRTGIVSERDLRLQPSE